MKISAREALRQAATSVFLQVYGNKRYRSQGPSLMQWLMLGSALADLGVALPPDWKEILTGEGASAPPPRVRRVRSVPKVEAS